MHYNVHYEYLYNALNRNALSVALHLIVIKIENVILIIFAVLKLFKTYVRYI